MVVTAFPKDSKAFLPCEPGNRFQRYFELISIQFAVLKRWDLIDDFGKDREPVITYIKGVKHIEFS
jgi:hypothetical protein